jgi:hypothetical protein
VINGTYCGQHRIIVWPDPSTLVSIDVQSVGHATAGEYSIMSEAVNVRVPAGKQAAAATGEPSGPHVAPCSSQ